MTATGEAIEIPLGSLDFSIAPEDGVRREARVNRSVFPGARDRWKRKKSSGPPDSSMLEGPDVP